MKITIEGENIKVSDGFHTIEELYEHRIVLFIALCRSLRTHLVVRPWISLKHADGSSYEGWFIVGLYEEYGNQYRTIYH